MYSFFPWISIFFFGQKAWLEGLGGGGGGGGEAETIKRLDEACNYCTIVINMDLLHETLGLFLRTGLRYAFASKRPDSMQTRRTKCILFMYGIYFSAYGGRILGRIRTKVFRVFLLAIHSHLH